MLSADHDSRLTVGLLVCFVKILNRSENVSFLISAIVFSTFVSAANAACNTYGTITTCDDG